MFNYYSINSLLLLDPRILDRFRQKKKMKNIGPHDTWELGMQL